MAKNHDEIPIRAIQLVVSSLLIELCKQGILRKAGALTMLSRCKSSFPAKNAESKPELEFLDSLIDSLTRTRINP